MKIRALAPWFGSKRNMAEDIIQELGPHAQFFDPFCGSMAILLSKPKCQKETVNDLHGGLTNLARVIADRESAEELYDRLTRAVVCEGLLKDAQEYLEDEPELGIKDTGEDAYINWAYWYFLASWMARNGVAGTKRMDYQAAVRWTKGGGSPTVRFFSAVNSIPPWHYRMQNVVILQRDAFSIIPRFSDDPDTAIYIDPPYPKETRSGFDDSPGKEHSYLHEFNHGSGGDNDMFGGEDDHSKLARMLRGFKKARIVVSTYDCPRYRKLYEGWTFIDHMTKKVLTTQNSRGALQGEVYEPAEAPELLIVNGESYAVR